MPEAVKKAEINQGPTRTVGQVKTDDPEVDMILKWQKESIHWQKEFTDKWEEQEQAYYGKTWKNRASQGKKAKPEINICRSTVQGTIPILTDARPGFNPIPRTPQQSDFALMLTPLIDKIWDDQSMPIKIVETLTDQSVIDIGVQKVHWNPELEDGIGDVQITAVNPRNISTNEGASGFTKDRNCKYVIERMFKPVGEARMAFPKYADKIHADSSGQAKDKSQGTYDVGTITIVSPVDVDQNKDKPIPGGRKDDFGLVEIWECWYCDESLEEYVKGEDDNGKSIKGLKKKYPNGHLTTILPNQKLKVQSTQNPNEGPDFNPYVRYVDTVIPRCLYGEGQVKPLMDTQKELNKVVQTVIQWSRLAANPWVIVDKNAGVNTDNLTNMIAQIIKKEQGTEVRRDWPESLPPYILELMQFFLRFGDVVSGLQEVSQGRKPKGVQAAEAIEALQEAAQTRMRLKERNMETSLSHLAKKIINLILQKYRGQRYVQIAGEGVVPPEFIEFNIEDIEDGRLQIQQQKSVWDVDQQKYIQAPLQTATAVKGPFDVRVVAGTSLPFQKGERSRMAMNLYDRGALTAEGLLEAVDWPEKEKELERLNQQAAAAAAAPPQPGV